MNTRQQARRREAAYSQSKAVGPGIPADTGEEDEQPVLVSADELEEIRWAGYDAAIADAIAHRDRALDAALERLDKVSRTAYLDYRQALEAADATFAAARRAAMHAHELAGQATS